MLNATLSAYPLPYSERAHTFRTIAGNRPATRTRLGSVLLVHFLEHRAFSNGFVRKLISEGRPAGIKNGFRHAGFGESFGTNVADCNIFKLSNDAGRELVMKVTPRISDAGMDVCGQALFVRSLCLRQLFRKLAEVTWILDLLPSGQRGKVLQAQVDANAGFNVSRGRICNLNNNVEEPVAAPVAGEIRAVLYLSLWQRAGVEYAKYVASESEGVSLSLQAAAFQRHPSKGLLAAIAKVRSLELTPGFRVLLAHGVDRAGQDAKFLAASCGETVQVKSGRPSLTPLECMFLRIVAVIPDEVTCARPLVQQAAQGFHAVTVHKNHVEIISKKPDNRAQEKKGAAHEH